MRAYRRPKTKQERTASISENLARPRRNAANLPTSWDDIRNSSLYDRSWKRFRKTKYRVKP